MAHAYSHYEPMYAVYNRLVSMQHMLYIF